MALYDFSLSSAGLKKTLQPLTLLFLLNFSVILSISPSTQACPAVCYCFDPIVDCYSRNLTEIPEDIMATAAFINLKGNQISAIAPDRLGRLQKVENLMMSHNQLTKLQSGAFFNMTSLKQLDLSQNLIREVEPEAFRDLPMINSIKLDNNQLEDVESFLGTGLSSLNFLSLSGNRISVISGTAFSNLTQLSYLVLSQNPLKNLDSIWTGVSMLWSLDASSCQLTTVPTGLPAHLRHLKLTNNSLTSLTIKDLQQTPYLGALHLDDNEIGRVEEGTFAQPPYLSKINLSGNKIYLLPNPIPANVTNFNADNNKIQLVYQTNFDHDSQMNFLSLRNNNIDKLAANTFSRMGVLNSLYLDNNAIEVMQQMTFSRLRQLRMLSLDSNPIREMERRALGGLARLTRLSLSGIKNEVAGVREEVFRDVPSLTNFNLQGSPHLVAAILNDSQVVQSLHSVKYLNLMQNNLTNLDAELEVWLPQLRSIRLMDNPWKCNENLAPLRKWMGRAPRKFTPSLKVLCHEPPRLSGQPIILVDVAQFTPVTTSSTTTSTTTPTRISNSTSSLFPSTIRSETVTGNVQKSTIVFPSTKSTAQTSFSSQGSHNAMTDRQTTTPSIPLPTDITLKPTTNSSSIATQSRFTSKSTTIQKAEVTRSSSSKPSTKIIQITTHKSIGQSTENKLSQPISTPFSEGKTGKNTAKSVSSSYDLSTTTISFKSITTMNEYENMNEIATSLGHNTDGKSSTSSGYSMSIAKAENRERTSLTNSTPRSGESRLAAHNSSTVDGKTKAIIIGVSTSLMCLVVALLLTVAIVRYRQRRKGAPAANRSNILGSSQNKGGTSESAFVNPLVDFQSGLREETTSDPDGKEEKRKSKTVYVDSEVKSGKKGRNFNFGLACLSSQPQDDSEMLVYSWDDANP